MILQWPITAAVMSSNGTEWLTLTKINRQMPTAAVYQVTALSIGLCAKIFPLSIIYTQRHTSSNIKYVSWSSFLETSKKNDKFTRSFHIHWPSSADGDRWKHDDNRRLNKRRWCNFKWAGLKKGGEEKKVSVNTMGGPWRTLKILAVSQGSMQMKMLAFCY